MKKSRLLVAALSIALTALFLTGCPEDGSNPPSGDNSNQNNNNPPPTQTTDPDALTQQTRVVLAEMFTGDWWGYCPFASRAIEQHAAELGPDKLLVLQYHYDDAYSTPKTEKRIDDNWLGGFPTMLFNGANPILGGSPASYEKQATVIERELAKTPPVAILASIDFSGGITIETTFTNTSDAAISDAELFVVIYEDLGSEEHHYTVRDILEPQQIASLAAGATQQLSATSDYSGSMTNLHAVVYIKASDGEVLQAALAG